jgi:ArsR family transcriptional regulator, arsenate/arsenite/antimonite-responsive transcriptional repressor
MKTSLQVLPPDPAEACCAPRPKLTALAMKPYARLFKALSDETRLEMIGLLAAVGAELCACDIESHFDLSQPTISHHLKILREAGLITGERRGTWIYYAINREAIERLAEFQKLAGG